MTDTIKRGPNLDIPEGYPVEGFGPGNPPQGSDDFIGLTEHGRHVPELISPPDWGVITSAVWGNIQVPINTKHGELATWDPCHTGERPWCCPCCWYAYAATVCMTGCVHPGMDIGVAKHTALYAAEGGTAVRVEWDTSYRPYHVRIRTASGETHIYGHMWSVDGAIVPGASVHAGQYLGTSGEQTEPGTMTPDRSGPHLHFERRFSNNCAVDPTIVLERATVFQHCTPVAPPPFDGTEKVINGVVFHPAKRTVTAAVDGLNVRRFASVQACKTREPLMAGETIKVLYWIKVADTGERWWVTEDGSRVWTGGTHEQP